MSWVMCHHCGHWFDLDNTKGDYGIIYFHGQIASHICPHCTAKTERVQAKEKT